MRYVNIRHGERVVGYDVKFKLQELDSYCNAENNASKIKKKEKEGRNGLFAYLAESAKLINYKDDGKVHIISLEKN